MQTVPAQLAMQPATRLKTLRQSRIDDALGPLRDRFLDDLPERAREIDTLMLAAEASAGASGDPSPYLRQIQAIAHRLAGVSTVLGFPKVGALSQRSELALAEVTGWRVDSEGADARALARVSALLDDLVIEMESHVAGRIVASSRA